VFAVGKLALPKTQFLAWMLTRGNTTNRWVIL
jgi:hypothetical protein